MNLYIREFKNNFKPLLVWSLSLVAIYYVASIEFAAFANNPAITDAMDQFEVLFQALGTASADMTTPQGFLSIMSIYIYLPLAIYSGLLGSGIISKEEKDKTAEYLFTLPVSRKKVIISKLLVAVTNSIIIDIMIMIGCIGAFIRFDPDPIFYTYIQNMAIGVFITQMIFLSLGVAFASILKQYKKSGSITIGIMISTFMINILIGFVEELDFLKYFSPFNYFNSNAMLNSEWELSFILISIGLIVAGISSLLIFYPKRDLYI